MAGASCTFRHGRQERYAAVGVRRPSVLIAAVLALLAGTAVAAGSTPEKTRRDQLIRFVLQDCGSCHGMTLKGGLGPALTPDALREKAAGSLVATILLGRPGTAMPPWRDFLSEAETVWIVDQLQKGIAGVR